VSISGDYPNPVLVNGYQCWNCTQVDEAKKGVDPANPKAGPYGIDAKTEPASSAAGRWGQAVTLGGALSGIQPGRGGAQPPQAGAALDLSV
jgi:hypothetical protein